MPKLSWQILNQAKPKRSASVTQSTLLWFPDLQGSCSAHFSCPQPLHSLQLIMPTQKQARRHQKTTNLKGHSKISLTCQARSAQRHRHVPNAQLAIHHNAPMSPNSIHKNVWVTINVSPTCQKALNVACDSPTGANFPYLYTVLSRPRC